MTRTTTLDAAANRAALAQAQAPLMPKATDAAALLTAAERAVLHWLAAGRSNAQIGLCVGRSEKTVRNQLTQVYAKLGVTNRAQAVAVHMRIEFGRHERR